MPCKVARFPLNRKIEREETAAETEARDDIENKGLAFFKSQDQPVFNRRISLAIGFGL
jgi:hypothetical protein